MLVGVVPVTVEIVEVLRRSSQGITEPFVCRGADNAIYFVKGRAAGRVSLVKEWVCGNLAQALELPIAPFEIVQIPERLIEASSEMHLDELGSGLAFGSRQRPLTNDIVFSQVERVPLGLRKDIAVFDRWIQNYDRTLSAYGGNPNLLWATDSGSVVIIDHNNAFDSLIDQQTFAETHIFGSDFLAVCRDANDIAAYRDRLDRALDRWDGIVTSLPQGWMFLDPQETVPINFNSNDVLGVLYAHREKGFWL